VPGGDVVGASQAVAQRDQQQQLGDDPRAPDPAGRGGGQRRGR
jgi:hypothetical protein